MRGRGESAIKINYFVESREESLRLGYRTRAQFLEERVFDERVLAALSVTGAGVSLAAFPAEQGLSDVVRELNRRGVPIDLWLNHTSWATGNRRET